MIQYEHMVGHKKLLIIDANSLIHRAFHALPPFATSKGEMVNAVYGFFSIFLKAIKEIHPDYIAAAFDSKGPTFRETKFKAYKAKREKAPDELYFQIPKIQAVLAAFQVPSFEKQGFEADDIIGTIAKKAPKLQAHPLLQTIILSGDMDHLQLVDAITKVYTLKKGIQDSVVYDTKQVKKRFSGLLPAQIIDWKALRGDPSDNIPGVPGIGEKIATQLLLDFGSVDNVYKALENNTAKDAIKPRIAKLLLENKEYAAVSKELAAIDTKVPLQFDLEDLAWKGFERKQVEELFLSFGFRSLLSRMKDVLGKNKEQHERKDETAEKIERLFQEDVFSEAIYTLELAISPVLRMMEKTGIQIDKTFFAKLKKELQTSLKKLEGGIAKKAGGAFNISSPKQLSEVLFERLLLSPRGLHKTPGGVVSTASSELEKLKDAHPMIKEVLHYRELAKLQTTYVLPLPKLADKEGRIHTHFDQLGAATGRLSSFSPNLQNIPVQGEWGKRIREGFVAKKGFSLVSCDYSQVELRIASHIAGEKKMQEIFLQNRDIHQETAAVVFGVEYKDVTAQMRFRAKALNFGILYGMGARGFSQSAGIPFEEAQGFIENYFVQFPHIALYMQDTIESTKELGYAQTLFGRKRYIPDIHSTTQYIRGAAERVAINHPIQGTQADIIKMAMVKIAKELNLQQKDCRMLLQIHDELLFEIADGIIHQRSQEIAALMQGAALLAVPLTVKVSFGKSWGKLQSIA
jgi:DNA polymerase I-like protein with 3'-5' exonuclease and polymerase domains